MLLADLTGEHGLAEGASIRTYLKIVRDRALPRDSWGGNATTNNFEIGSSSKDVNKHRNDVFRLAQLRRAVFDSSPL